MKASTHDLPAIVNLPEGVIRAVKWGDMMVESGDMHQSRDGSANFKGLPDDRCQCPHWGYVIKGQMRYRFADHEELFSAGELFYLPPGHVPMAGEGCEWIDFSPYQEYAATMEVIARNAKNQK